MVETRRRKKKQLKIQKRDDYTMLDNFSNYLSSLPICIINKLNIQASCVTKYLLKKKQNN